MRRSYGPDGSYGDKSGLKYFSVRVFDGAAVFVRQPESVGATCTDSGPPRIEVLRFNNKHSSWKVKGNAILSLEDKYTYNRISLAGEDNGRIFEIVMEI